MSTWKIPVMDDPMGRSWRQPKGLRDRVGLFFSHATISEADFFSLPNYETSFPTGVYPGKVWRVGQKWIRWFGPDRDGKCKCCILRVLHPTPPKNSSTDHQTLL